MITAIVFIVTLGLLIFVHEFGHFITARKSGIKAEEFGFGFPPRAIGIYWNEKKKRYAFVWGKKYIETKETIFSLNWIPLGGFVRIKGEDGSMAKDPDSFAAKSASKRILVLAAGVLMNFFLVWVLLSMVFMIGAPLPEEIGIPNSGTYLGYKIQAISVMAGTPAEKMGLEPGDEIVRCKGNLAICNKRFSEVTEVQSYINENKGKEVVLTIKRGEEYKDLSAVPRIDYPSDEGSLGFQLSKSNILKFPWYEAIGRGFGAMIDLFAAIFEVLGKLIGSLFGGEKVDADVSGPVGIYKLTDKVASLGIVYILQFAALLSINLGIINILPFPALDGGRILFILIEKIKGSPISQKVEQAIHSSGFILLILLMVFITFRDLVKENVIEKIRNLF